MSAIFISHSSRDHAIAGELKARLEQHGHRSVFLDFDPEDGVPAGRDWERELYARLRGCQAVLVLCSEHSMASRWCFAEIALARFLGKSLMPIRVDDCVIPSTFADVQLIDFRRDREQGYQRLWAGLRRSGLDPAEMFDWDGSRPPYPGLMVFQEQDAAVYFGRDAEIQATIEKLNRMQVLGDARLAMVMGASGSGKSSLLRAGVVPRLKQYRDRWLIVGPVRPLRQPFVQLAIALSAALKSIGAERPWEAICDRLAQSPADRASAFFMDMADDLRVASGQLDAVLLLAVDQFEELLGERENDAEVRFLALLRSLVDARRGFVIIIGTLRSDFLGSFQNHAALRGVPYEAIDLPQLSIERFAKVIEGPARKAGLELESGLSSAIVTDAATDDALPLVAFTLRELWEARDAEGRLTIERYRNGLGGLQGSVAKAADGLYPKAFATPDEERDLRKAFLALVRVDPAGAYVRKPARWNDLPSSAHGLLERFVRGRLLVSRGECTEERVLEAAHEALIRRWGKLSGWVEEDREFLRTRERMEGAAARWLEGGHDPSLLLSSGRPLAEAQDILAKRRPDLAPEVTKFIDASTAARRSEETRRRSVAAIGIGVFAFLATSLFWYVLDDQRQQRDNYLVQAITWRGNLDPQRRSKSLNLLAKAANLRLANLRGRDDLRDEAVAGMALLELQNPKFWDGYPLGSKGIGFNSNLERYARGDAQGNISIRRVVDDKELMRVPGFGSEPWVLRFSSDDRYLAAKYDTDQLKGQLYLWDLSRPGTEATYLGATCGTAFDFEQSSKLLAVGRCDGSGSIDMFDLRVTSSTPTRSLKHAAKPEFIVFRPDGRQLAVSSSDQPAVQVLDLKQDKVVLIVSIPTGVIGIAWNADGRLLAAAAADHRIYVWDVANLSQDPIPPQPLQVLTGHESTVKQVAFSAPSNLLASTADDETVRIWEPISGKELIRVAGASPMQFSADGRRLAFKAGTQRLVYWELAAPSEYSAVRSHEAPALEGPWSADFSPDGRLLASAHGDGLRIWDLSNNKEIAFVDRTEDGERLGYIRSVLFDPDGTKLITCGPGDEGVRGRGGVYIWSIESQPGGIANALPVRKSRKLDLPNGAVCEWAALVDHGRTLVVADSFNGKVMRRDLNHSTEWTLLPAVHDVKFVAAHPDARYIAYGEWKVGIWVLDLKTNSSKELERGAASFFAAFSPNGKWLVTGSADYYHIWEVGSWAKPVHELPGYHGISGLVGALAFSPDGTVLAIARSSSEVELVNANKSWEKIVILTSSDNPALISWLKFSADGSRLAVVTHAHVINIWDLHAIREQLAKMDLDWALPPYSASQTLLAPGQPVRFGLSGTNGR
jgi:WD40 repeat protein